MEAEAGSTVAGAVDSTVVAEQRFTEEGVLAAEPALRMSAGAPTPAIVEAPMLGAATMEGAAITVAADTTVGVVVTAGATDGVAAIGAEDMVTDGAGELALGGRIGAGDIRTPLITVPGITRRTPIILTHTTALRTIPMAIRILIAGTTILPPQIPTHGRSRTRADRQELGDLPYLEARPTRAMQTATLRRAGQFCPLTG